MELGDWSLLEWLALIEHELLLFAGFFFLLGALDELAIDVTWGWLRLTGRARSWRIDRAEGRSRPLAGQVAVMIPAWLEHEVITATIAYTLRAWPQEALRIYVGCYRNDPSTAEAILRGTDHDPRMRLVVHDREGPTTKADCLNRLYSAMEQDEQRSGSAFRLVVLHDAEDMVDPAALALLDAAVEEAEFIQLPVLPEPQRQSRWVGSHYCEEFAEAHGKAMVVREALSAGLPAAGVGCAFSRDMLRRIAEESGGIGPFSVDSLTEDYELGLRIKAHGGRSRFLRVRGDDGKLVATRACFPPRLDQSVQQKGRWIHGIALQGWDRLGWGGSLGETWMRLRDRRGPLSAVVLFAGYLLLVIGSVLWTADAMGLERPWPYDPLVEWLIAANAVSFAWRAAARYAFTAHEYGSIEGLRAILRIPLANIITVMAGRRALFAYARTLMGGQPKWDKTFHHAHPTTVTARGESTAGVMAGARAAPVARTAL
jgi:adsorption protein B